MKKQLQRNKKIYKIKKIYFFVVFKERKKIKQQQRDIKSFFLKNKKWFSGPEKGYFEFKYKF